MSYKIVENYQLSESSSYIQDGIQIYIAQHAISKLPYLLKKVNTKQSADRGKYQSLINEIGILKTLSSPLIVQCHKMLKTSNNIYLVYDYCDGLPLSEIMSNNTKQQNINIIFQIVQALKIMSKASIVHSNLKPSSIIISNDSKIKIMNFTFGHNRQNKKTIPVRFKPPVSNYVAPEIIRQGNVHKKSDFYSLGVIISEMNLCSNSTLSVMNTNQLASVIEKMKLNDPNQRPQLKQLQTVLKDSQEMVSPQKKSQELDKKVKEEGESGSFIKANSIYSNKDKDSDRSDNKLVLPVQPPTTKDTMEKQKKFVQQILKKRNLAIFLLQMSQACLLVEDEQKKLGIFLSYILMKKSCSVICGLLNFLKGDKQYQKEIDKCVLDKTERANFEKKPDFFKLLSTIQKQAGNQKRWLEDIYRNISSEIPQKWKEIANEQLVEDQVLLNFIVDFLREVVDGKQESVTDKLVESLYLMSQIIQHKSYEKMFEEMISESKTSLDEQHLYILVKKMKRKQLLFQIAGRIKSEI